MSRARDNGNNYAGDKPKIIDAAGDLIYGTGSDAATSLAIGTVGQVLQVNSGATAPEWAPASVSSPPQLNDNSTGNWVFPNVTGALSDISPTTNRTYYVPIYLPSGTLDRIGIRSTPTFTTAGTVRLGLYNNGADNKPSTVKLDAGTVSVGATNTEYTITINETISEGWYWFAANRQSGDFRLFQWTSNSLFSNLISNAPNLSTYLTASAGGAAVNKGYFQGSVTDSFATATDLNLANAVVIGGVRYA
jgi:hypothetical protein